MGTPMEVDLGLGARNTLYLLPIIHVLWARRLLGLQITTVLL